MTNKKFKVAAMSMALTACVAAQPLIANAADDINTAPSNDTPAQTEDAPAVEEQKSENTEEQKSENDASGQNNTENESEQSDGANKESTGKKEEAFGEDVDIKYDREHPTKEDPETGATTIEGEVVKKDDTGSADEDKKSDFDGNAEKTETPDPDSTVKEDPVPKPGTESVTKTDTKVDSDGTTTITDTTTVEGTQTTTTTGSGHAEADTKETTEDTTEIGNDFLDKELGTIDWGVEKDDKVGTDKDNPYKVIGKDEETTGNKTKQTLTLEKVEETKGKMTAEDIAKLVDADPDAVDKKEDGSYTLKRTETVTDENGSPVTRTTYITVRDGTDEVTITTTTTIKVTREKEEHHEGDTVDVSKDFTLPEITLDNESKETISSEKLKDLLAKAGAPDSTTKGQYTVREGNREYTITVNKEAADKLSNDEIKAKLGDDYKVEVDKDGNSKIYYVGNGQHAELTVDQEKVIREHLSYTIKVRETNKDTETTVVGKDEAEAEAKDEAVRNALKNAVKDMLSKGTITEEEAKELEGKIDSDTKIDAAKDGQFEAKVGDRSFTLDYKAGTITSTSENPRKDKDDDKTTDNKDLTANGSSYVTSGTVSWTDSKTGEGKHSEFEGDKLELPEGATVVKKEGSTTIYEVKSADGKTTRYEVTEEELTLSDLGENEKKDLAWKQLEKETGKSRGQLEKEGYKVTDVTFTGSIKKVSWTVTETETTTTTDTVKKDLSDIIYVDGGKKWTIDEKAGTITVGDNTYTITKKNADGSYTCEEVDENNHKTSYTFTEKDSTSSLTEAQIKGLLVDQLKKDFSDITADDIILSTDGKTASYTKDGKTVTIDYSKLGKELEIVTADHGSSSITATIETDKDLEKAYDDLWALIQEKYDNLKPGEELWLEDYQVTDKTEKKDIIQYITKAVSSDNMSKDELRKALEEQARVAQTTDVTVNEGKKDHKGNDIEEVLKNFYSGEKADVKYRRDDGQIVYSKDIKVEYDRYGRPYYRANNRDWYYLEVVSSTGKDDYIGHLDLASDSQLDLLPDANGKSETTDCVLVSKDLKLKWNYNADDLVHDKNNTTVSLEDKITFDSEDGKNGSGHYEYNRGSNYEKTLPTKSAYYKLTGTVVYDAVKDEATGKVKQYDDNWQGYEAAKKAYREKTGLSKDEVTDADYAKYIVKVGDKWQVYTKSSELEAYGYMSRDANTCTNRTYRNQDKEGDGYYVGGFDLMISKLVQVREGKIIGQTESNIKTITAPWSIRTTEKKTDDWLQLAKKTTETTTTTTDPKEVGKGSNSTTAGDFNYKYTHDQEDTFDWTESGTTSGVEGTGDGHYTSFVNWVDSFFHGESGEQTKQGGSFSYNYDYTTVSDLQGEHLTQTVEKHAEVDYDYTIKDVRNVDIVIDQEVTIITPDGGGDEGGGEIIEEKTPESPILPGNVELPPVQDARPDAPVLPADPVLPAVQDAHVLPQTGVNWLTAIGLAISGMALMITGAFASLTGKNARH